MYSTPDKNNLKKEERGNPPHQPIQELHITKVYKNISINMLKDVGMTVPKGRETRAVYMQQHRE